MVALLFRGNFEPILIALSCALVCSGCSTEALLNAKFKPKTKFELSLSAIDGESPFNLISGDTSQTAAPEMITAESGGSPGARSGAALWLDSNSDVFWLFGGRGFDENGNEVVSSNLWRFEIESGEWKKVSASGPSAPPSRTGAMTYVDKDGVLILFGGRDGDSFFSDLWKYDPVTRRWAELVYDDRFGDGWPKARSGGISWYDPATNRFYLYGGRSEVTSSDVEPALLSDFWMLKINNGIATWTKKNHSETSYGNPATGTQPGGVAHSGVAWIEDVIGNRQLCFFGGLGKLSEAGEIQDGFSSRTYCYSILNENWKLIGDAQELNLPPSDKPGGLSGAVSAHSGNSVYLFGGRGFGVPGQGLFASEDPLAAVAGSLADLWKYDTDKKEWSHVFGSKGAFVDVGIDADLENLVPGSFYDGAGAIRVSATDEFWIYGGTHMEGLVSEGEEIVKVWNTFWRILLQDLSVSEETMGFLSDLQPKTKADVGSFSSSSAFDVYHATEKTPGLPPVDFHTTKKVKVVLPSLH